MNRPSKLSWRCPILSGAQFFTAVHHVTMQSPTINAIQKRAIKLLGGLHREFSRDGHKLKDAIRAIVAWRVGIEGRVKVLHSKRVPAFTTDEAMKILSTAIKPSWVASCMHNSILNRTSDHQQRIGQIATCRGLLTACTAFSLVAIRVWFMRLCRRDRRDIFPA